MKIFNSFGLLVGNLFTNFKFTYNFNKKTKNIKLQKENKLTKIQIKRVCSNKKN